MPFTVRIERAPDRPDTQSIMYGPMLYPILGTIPASQGGYQKLTLYRHLKLDGDYARAAITKSTGDELHRRRPDAAPALRRRHAAALAVLPADRAEHRVRLDRHRRAERQARRRPAQLRRPGHRDHVAGQRRPDVPGHRLGPRAVRDHAAFVATVTVDGDAFFVGRARSRRRARHGRRGGDRRQKRS